MTAPAASPAAVVTAGGVSFGNHLPISLIAGPCQIESAAHAFECASALKEICARLGIGLVFKSSFDKANRTSISGARGVGLDASLRIFADIKSRLGLPVLTDVHEREQCAPVAEVVDILQIPAFLCRQTDLLIAAAQTGAVVNVKKGQFLAPWDMKNVLAKVTQSGNPRVMATERGTSFGYNTLVSDFRALPIMARVWRAGDLRCDPFRAAAGRAGRRLGRAARICARPGPRGRGGGRGGAVHRDAPGPRQRAIGRAEHDRA